MATTDQTHVEHLVNRALDQIDTPSLATDLLIFMDAKVTDALTVLGNEVLRFAPDDFDDDVAQEEIVVRYVRWLERMAINSRGDIVFTAHEVDDERLQELADVLLIADVMDGGEP